MKKFLPIALAALLALSPCALAFNPARFEGVENVSVAYDPENPAAYTVKAGFGGDWSQYGGHMVVRYMNAGKTEELPLMLISMTTSGTKAAQMEIRTDAHRYQTSCTDLSQAGMAAMETEGALLVAPDSIGLLRDMAESSYTQITIRNADASDSFSFLLTAQSRDTLTLFLAEYDEEIAPLLETSATLASVYRQLAPVVSVTDAPAIGEEALEILNAEYVTLQNGSQGDAVLRLQQALDRLDKLYYKADGMYGKHTARSVREFQQSIGMTANGVADAATQIALYMSVLELDGPVEETAPEAADTPAPVTEADPASTLSPEAQARMDAAAEGIHQTEYAVLRSGDRGEAVMKLQQALRALGMLDWKVDGIYGEHTVRGIEAFQQSQGLAVDGVAGTETQIALYLKALELEYK